MLTFKKMQKSFCVGDIHVGGQPGELPTLLIGTIFYEGHKVVKDAKKGLFDRESAERLINRQEELSEKTGNPCMVDVVGLTPTAMRRYIDFIADITNAPILIDSAMPEVKIAGIKYAMKTGLLPRVLYNSISYNITDEEITTLRDVGAKSAIVLAYNPRNVWPNGRVEILRGGQNKKGLLKIVEDAGIENPLIDVAVLDVPSIGLAAEAVYLVKNEIGLPAGGAPLNAVLEWRPAKEYGKYADKVCAAASAVVMQCSGADFILYGPIKNAEVIFPAVAMTDALIAYEAKLHGVQPKTKHHPLYKIF